MAAATDVAGRLLVADTLNQRLRSDFLPVLNFPAQSVGILSASQSVTLTNTGTSTLTVSKVGSSGAFTISSDGSCAGVPFSLLPGASCTENVAFLPLNSGGASGSLSISGPAVVAQTVLLAGVAVPSATTVSLASDQTSVFLDEPVVFTATVKPAGVGVPGGTVSFYDGVAQIGTAQAVANGSASFATADLATGTHNITAVYSGDASFTGSTSVVVSEAISDFGFSIISSPSNPGGSVDQTIFPGRAAVFALALQPVAGSANFPVTLSATGLPPGATVTFSPQTVMVGTSPANFTMTIQTSSGKAALEPPSHLREAVVTFALLLLPCSGAMRRKAQQLGPLTMLAFLLGGGAVLATLTGCGSDNGFFAQPQKAYTIEVIGTAKGASGATLQHIASVKLTLR